VDDTHVAPYHPLSEPTRLDDELAPAEAFLIPERLKVLPSGGRYRELRYQLIPSKRL